MTRPEAVNTIYEIINSGILDMDLEERLTTVAEKICTEDWEECTELCTEYGVPCKGCPFEKQDEE